MMDTTAQQHNERVEAEVLAYWRTRPERMVGYFTFPAEGERLAHWADTFRPSLTDASVTTWMGAELGAIIDARVYTTHGAASGRMVALRVRATDGTEYYGRASWDNGTCVVLRRAKAR